MSNQIILHFIVLTVRNAIKQTAVFLSHSRTVRLFFVINANELIYINIERERERKKNVKRILSTWYYLEYFIDFPSSYADKMGSKT